MYRQLETIVLTPMINTTFSVASLSILLHGISDRLIQPLLLAAAMSDSGDSPHGSPRRSAPSTGGSRRGIPDHA